jgi:hypothetical protein
MSDITLDLLNQIYEYRDGKLFWKIKFTDKVVVGKEVGRVRGKYKSTKINKKDYDIHRLVFLMHKGYLPKCIDHIDGDKFNNCIENLREANYLQNAHNSKIKKTNTSGFKNVTWKKERCKWKVEVSLKNKRHFFGYFDSLFHANEVAKQARNLLHKEFARHE